MVKRCDNCKRFSDAYEISKTSEGYPVCTGWCDYKEDEVLNMHFACEHGFIPNDEYIKSCRQLPKNQERLEMFGVLEI